MYTLQIQDEYSLAGKTLRGTYWAIVHKYFNVDLSTVRYIKNAEDVQIRSLILYFSYLYGFDVFVENFCHFGPHFLYDFLAVGVKNFPLEIVLECLQKN